MECDENLTRGRSGLVKVAVETLDINITKNKRLLGSSFVPTPAESPKTHGVFNVQK